MRVTACRRLRLVAATTLAAAVLLCVPEVASAQAITGTCASCSGGAPDPNCGACIASGSECFNSLMPADRRLTVFQTSDGHDARSLTFGHLVGGASTSAADINRAVNRGYDGGSGWLYYGSGAPAGYCAPDGGPPAAFATDPEYHFGWNHVFEDALDGLDCYNAEVDRFYVGVAPTHADGDRVCDGEQGFFDPANGAIFDLGGESNRVAVFPYTDHGPLPCESWEYSVWLSDNPMATEVAEAGHPDSTKWNPAVLTTVFLQGWIPDNPPPTTEAAALSPDLGNPTERDGSVQLFALPCGLTFRYASVVAGNNGNPTPACAFYSFDAELDAVAGLNEDNTAICPDADGDGFRAMSCGGTDCNDSDPNVHPGAFERCDATVDLNCLPMTPCPSGTVCDPASGLCSAPCFEGGCTSGYTCVSGVCVDTACATRTDPCPDGTVCRNGDCVGPCDGVVCPPGQRCLGGACLDPCQGVTCPVNQVCIARDPSALTLCGPSCTCTDLASPLCTGSTACDARPDSATAGLCVDPGCDTATCGMGQVCVGGSCVDACMSVVCPHGQSCTGGECTPDPCANVTCPSGNVCRDGTCVDACDGVTCPADHVCDNGECVLDRCAVANCPSDTHCVEGRCMANEAGVSAFDAGDGSSVPKAGGCGCRVAARGDRRPAAPFAIGLLATLLLWRRRRRGNGRRA